MDTVVPPDAFSNWRTWLTDNTDTTHEWVNHVAGMKLRIQPIHEPFSTTVDSWRLQHRPWGPSVSPGTRWESVGKPAYNTTYGVARAAHGYARTYNERTHPRGGDGFDPL